MTLSIARHNKGSKKHLSNKKSKNGDYTWMLIVLWVVLNFLSSLGKCTLIEMLLFLVSLSSQMNNTVLFFHFIELFGQRVFSRNCVKFLQSR